MILTLILLDVGFILAEVEAGTIGHAAMATVNYALVVNLATGDAVGHVLLIAPPLLLPLGIVILSWCAASRLRVSASRIGTDYGGPWTASLFTAADIVVTIAMLAHVLWVILAAITLIVRSSARQSAEECL